MEVWLWLYRRTSVDSCQPWGGLCRQPHYRRRHLVAVAEQQLSRMLGGYIRVLLYLN